MKDQTKNNLIQKILDYAEQKPIIKTLGGICGIIGMMESEEIITKDEWNTLRNLIYYNDPRDGAYKNRNQDWIPKQFFLNTRALYFWEPGRWDIRHEYLTWLLNTKEQ